mmetsp:Transcript_13593/g.36006  ORF Transcript_13593/g.36006 Transcript_13593/m.36006 type:complete len:202 (-) Transcript_13593:231-836(-)
MKNQAQGAGEASPRSEAHQLVVELLGLLRPLLLGDPVVGLRQGEEVLTVRERVQARLHEHRRERIRLIRLLVVLRPLQVTRLRVLAHGEGAAVHLHAALVHLLGEDAIRGVHEHDLASLVDAVDLVVLDLVLAELLAERDALLLLAEVAEVLALVHDGVAARRHLEGHLLLGAPGDGVPLARRPGHVAAGRAHVGRELVGD